MIGYTTITTEHGSRYLQQLCKHFAHALTVAFDPQQGTIDFPAELRGHTFSGSAQVRLQAIEDGLGISIDASDLEQMSVLKKVVIDHLERFAFREAPLAASWSVS